MNGERGNGTEQSGVGDGKEGEDWLSGTDLRHITQQGPSGQPGEQSSFVEFWEIIKIIQATTKKDTSISSIFQNIVFEDMMNAPEGMTQEKKIMEEVNPSVLIHCSIFTRDFAPPL